jgi:hypothetical protein
MVKSFPTVYKELKLGKVVGYPSSGAVIGTSPYYLIDGSEMRMPGSGWFKLMEAIWKEQEQCRTS